MSKVELVVVICAESAPACAWWKAKRGYIGIDTLVRVARDSMKWMAGGTLELEGYK